MQDVRSRRLIRPIDLAGILVHRNETRRVGRGKIDVSFVKAVAGVDKQDIPQGGD